MVFVAERAEIIDLSADERAHIEAALVEGEDRSSLIRTAIAKELKARARTAARARRSASALKVVQARLLSTRRTQDGLEQPVVLVETRTGRGWKLHYDRQFASSDEALAWIQQQGYALFDPAEEGVPTPGMGSETGA